MLQHVLSSFISYHRVGNNSNTQGGFSGAVHSQFLIGVRLCQSLMSKNGYGYKLQSVPITTDGVSSNLDQGEVYNIMWYSLSVVFSGSSGFLHQQNWPPRYSWNSVESGVKHFQTSKENKQTWTVSHGCISNFHTITTTTAPILPNITLRKEHS
jgi:hypothetical protein